MSAVTVAELANNPLVTRIEITVADPAAPVSQPTASVVINHRPAGGRDGDNLWHVSGPDVPKPDAGPWESSPGAFTFIAERLETPSLDEALNHAATQLRLCTYRLEDAR